MARRRVISAELLVDPEFNSVSMEAQILFFRMLVVSDDFGIVPIAKERLCTVLNLTPELRANVETIIQELIDERLGHYLEYEGKRFFVFKPVSFRHWQAQLLSRRSKSEYLRNMPGEKVLKMFAQQFQIHLEDFGSEAKTSDLKEESRKQKEDSSEQKARSRERDSLEDIPPVFQKVRQLQIAK